MKNPLFEGSDFYYNSGGLMVLTAEYLLRKGSCCGNGCLHCPYDYENVPEPRRRLLQKERNTEINQPNTRPVS